MDLSQLIALQQASLQEIYPQMEQVVAALTDTTLLAAATALILKYPTEATPAIDEALKGENSSLQQVLLTDIIPYLPFYSKMVLADAVEALAEQPSTEQFAKNALQSFVP